MLRRVLGYFGVGALLAVSVWAFITIRSFNAFEEIPSQFAGKCEAVTGIAGPEDLQFDYATRKVFISSFDRRAKQNGLEDGLRGSVYLFDINNPFDDNSWRDRTDGMPADFEPLGLHYYQDETSKRLFVVNGASNSIELFDVLASGDLSHVETFTERRLTSPKDIVAVGPRAFYVTNDKNAGRDTIRGKLDFLFRLRTGVIYYFNGTSWHRAADNIRYANGLAVAKNAQSLYVAETAGGKLLEYKRDTASGYLSYVREITIGAGVDNINTDEDGMLWIGAHPRPLALARHSRNGDSLAPSKVFLFNPENDTLETIYSDDGATLSGSSSAARMAEKLLIGALYEEKFLICDMANQGS